MVCLLFDLNKLATVVTVIFADVPGVSSAYVLAGQLGGNQRLLGAMIGLQTVLAIISLPIVIWLLGT